MSTFPPRCFTCGKVTIWQRYENAISDGTPVDEALDKLGYRKMCCRRMFLGHVPELEEHLMSYGKIEKHQERSSFFDFELKGSWADQ